MAEILHRELSFAVVGAAMDVHTYFGPGFLEAVYRNALIHELTVRHIPFEANKKLPVNYKEVAVGDYYADIVVDNKIILELKVVQALNAAHKAQALHYLAATKLELAILLNFGTAKLGMERVVFSR